MINLLPDETKRDIRAARMNVVLLRYNLLTVGAAVLLALFCLVFYAILHDSQSTALNTASSNNTKAANLAKVRQEAEDYRKNLAIASQIIDNGVSYTNVVIEITKLIPQDVVLNNLNITADSFGKQQAFSAQAKSIAAATQLKDNLENSNIFSNVFFETVAVGDKGTPYPVTVSISAKLNKEAAQLSKEAAQ